MEIKYLYFLLCVVDDMEYLELYDGSLEVEKITNKWYNNFRLSNFGVIITFVGVVRDEDEIEGLSFDIYEPILNSWFESWQQKAKAKNAIVLMAHSRGDVLNHTSSYIAAVCSPKRRVALELIDEFVEDFKASAPIWKYDIIARKRVYAEERSTAIDGAGLLK
jgi:molybdopterin synthase catalytic subunit